jgi:hypothetical protein
VFRSPEIASLTHWISFLESKKREENKRSGQLLLRNFGSAMNQNIVVVVVDIRVMNLE